MKTGIVLPKGDILPDGIMSAFFFLSQANSFQRMQGKPDIFDLTIIGDYKTNWIYGGHFGVRAIPYAQLNEKLNLIIVPGFIDEKIPLEENSPLIHWLENQYVENHTELASMCTGAFLIAATGLLDGKKCTTHWAFKDAFIRAFPDVRLETDRIITDEDGIYTSAGAFSSLSLLLYLIEKYCDKATAIWLSKVFQVDIHRHSQRPFMILNQLFDHGDEQIKNLQVHIEQHYSEELQLDDLSKKFAFSRRTMVRRFKAATGITPIVYIQQVRVEAAKRELENSIKRIDEIIYSCGYNDGATFRKIFKKNTGLTPGAYRAKYQKMNS